jgi:hypothetical protein
VVSDSYAVENKENIHNHLGYVPSRFQKVGSWLRREGSWSLGSAAIGMAASVLTAKVALVALPVFAATAGGIVVANIATTGFRMMREAAQEDQKELIARGAEKQSMFKLMMKHARQDDLSKTFLKRVVTGVAISAATMGTVRNFSTISTFFSGLFNSHSGLIDVMAADTVVSVPVDPAVDCNAPQVKCGTFGVEKPVDAVGAVDVAPEVKVQQVVEVAEPTPAPTPAPAPIVTAEVVIPLSALDRVTELLSSGDNLSVKAKALIEQMVAYPDNAQNIKDAAQSLVRSHEDLAKDLYKQAIDKAAETGQKTAWGQASIDLAYLEHKVDPAAALAQMQNVVDNTKGALHRIAQEFVDQWKGIHSTHIAPVDVVQNKVAGAVTGDAVVQSAGDPVSQQAAVAPSLVVPDVVAQESSTDFGRAQAAWNENYARQQVVDILTRTGSIPDANLSALELARQVSPNNPQALLNGLAQNAPSLDPSKMAFSCVTDIPRDFPPHHIEVKTQCAELKPTMDVNDFGIVSDKNDPSPRGLRLLFKGAVEGCTKVVDCIDRFVTRAAVPAMTGEMRLAQR